MPFFRSSYIFCKGHHEVQMKPPLSAGVLAKKVSPKLFLAVKCKKLVDKKIAILKSNLKVTC